MQIEFDSTEKNPFKSFFGVIFIIFKPKADGLLPEFVEPGHAERARKFPVNLVFQCNLELSH